MDFKFGAVLIISAQICTTLALPPCVCTRNLNPVCGSNGVDYSNPCLLECSAYTSGTTITIAKFGPCVGSLPQVVVPEECVCIEQYEPVCGTDGQTYSNECKLNCHKINFNPSLKVEHAGHCKTPSEPSSVCPLTESPVCGSDGITYGNTCMLNAATQKNPQLTAAHDGPCDPRA